MINLVTKYMLNNCHVRDTRIYTAKQNADSFHRGCFYYMSKRGSCNPGTEKIMEWVWEGPERVYERQGS